MRRFFAMQLLCILTLLHAIPLTAATGSIIGVRNGVGPKEPATFDLPDCLPRTAMIVLTYLSSPRLPVARLVEEAACCGAAP